jgi:hypothetical protein
VRKYWEDQYAEFGKKCFSTLDGYAVTAVRTAYLAALDELFRILREVDPSFG